MFRSGAAWTAMPVGRDWRHIGGYLRAGADQALITDCDPVSEPARRGSPITGAFLASD
jgi:hypothetical protein